jgi:septum formation protein
VRRLAQEKAARVARRFPASLVIAADTVILLPGRIVGKPDGPEGAVRILRSLQGREHEVLTGVCVLRGDGAFHRIGVERSVVRFRPLRDDEIRDYVATGEPLDKAGAYAIQGIGGRYASVVSGSVSNVIGLPIERLRPWLAEASGA